MSPESRLRFELTLETILEKNRALGACVVLRRPSGAHETFCFGTARLLGRVPVTEETCFRVASVSKLVMTFGALALVERGVLGLDDDLSAFLGYPVRNPRFPDAPVTLRMLLTHTASIRDEGNYGSRGMQKGCTLRELLENADNWLPARPGEAFHYTNLGAGAAGAAMERAGERVVYINCSGDPDSLDAAIFLDRNAAIVDGTSPHVLEPTYAVASERYVDLTRFYDVDAAKARRAEIVALSDEYRAHYRSAYRILRAMGEVESERRVAMHAQMDFSKTPPPHRRHPRTRAAR